jgi:hypothetical protein
MALSSSNLEAYKYDLAVGVTQDSINATMKRFLNTLKAPAFSAYWVRDKATKSNVQTSLEEIQKAFGNDKFDPFTLAASDTAKIERLYSACKFRFGFRAKMGLPSGVAKTALEDIITLDHKDGHAITYLLYCSQFDIVTIEYEDDEYIFKKLIQSAKKPWCFKFTVNLDMTQKNLDKDSTEFKELPDDVRAEMGKAIDRIRNIDPNTMFSMGQLYLDLNSRSLQENTEIAQRDEKTGALVILDPTSAAYDPLTRGFVNGYLKSLPTSGVVFGYTLKVRDAKTPLPSLIPTDFNIRVSPHLDAAGKPSGKFGLYTLNYQVMSEGRRMPESRSFSWNWVEENQARDMHGVMAVRRDVFAEFLRKLVEKNAWKLSFQPIVSMTHKRETMYTTLEFEQDKKDPLKWDKTSCPTSRIDPGRFTDLLQTEWRREMKDNTFTASRAETLKGFWNIEMSGRIAVRSQDRRSIIRFEIKTSSYLAVDYEALGFIPSRFNGHVVKRTDAMEYAVSVDNRGKLVVEAGKLEFNDTSENINTSSLDKFFGLGSLGRYVQEAKEKLHPAVVESIAGYAADIQSLLNDTTGWVFPGGQTFGFSNVSFSEYQDLVTQLVYAKPG